MELKDSPDSSLLAQAIGGALDDGYLEDPVAARALAGAELVAGLAGRPASNLPKEIAAWLEANRGLAFGDLVEDAQAAVKRIAQDSETRELVAESELLDEWLAMLKDLQARLSLVKVGER